MAVEVFSTVHHLYGTVYQTIYELARNFLFLRVYLRLICSILLILNELLCFLVKRLEQ
ncbi:hypothetical protein HOLleu_27868 [Holothuria leucospilota]|uniref:Uncharacterized protein n=1 Tax=Holothuria leucospilota TaxID=206669 RepID=A0A9Q1BR12_HOLLE|nr:hypothetical protein HOLleu_27868 [Holothuria leucospilota]